MPLWSNPMSRGSNNNSSMGYDRRDSPPQNRDPHDNASSVGSTSRYGGISRTDDGFDDSSVITDATSDYNTQHHKSRSNEASPPVVRGHQDPYSSRESHGHGQPHQEDLLHDESHRNHSPAGNRPGVQAQTSDTSLYQSASDAYQEAGSGNQRASHQEQGNQQNRFDDQQQAPRDTNTPAEHGRNAEAPAANTGKETADDESSVYHGLQNASTYETNDSVAFVNDVGEPIAQAVDFSSPDADVVFLSSETGRGAARQPAMRFRIHSVNLNVHSAVLSEMVDDDEDSDSNSYNDHAAKPPPPINLEEDGATLKLLFSLMYNKPSPILTMSDWQVVLRLARAAQKYQVVRAKEVAAAFFTEQEQLGTLSPFMTFAFASQYGLLALEEASAERSTKYDINRCPEPIFQMQGFAAHQKLSRFHQRRQAHYSDVLNSIAFDPAEMAEKCYFTTGVCAITPWNRLRTKLAWPRSSKADGSIRPPEPADVMRRLCSEVGTMDCGSCTRALVDASLQVQHALETLPSYVESDDSF